MNGLPVPDVGFLLNKATRQFRLKLAEALVGLGLTPQQAAVLIAIGRSAKKRLTPRAIAEAVDTDQPTMSGLLDRLTRDGWLVAEPNPEDGRSRLIILSEKAAVALPEVLESADRVSSQATACLSQDEVKTLRELLMKLCLEDVTVAAKKKAGNR